MASGKKSVLKIFAWCLILPAVLCSGQPQVVNSDILTQKKPIGDCHACKIFIESFKSGLDRTSRGKYEGGDAAWEEEKLQKSYKRSEMRLIDIQDGLCKNSEYSVQCFSMAEKAEEFIEQWWAQNPDESDDLFTYICIDKMKVCCPPLHYGKDCKPCLGDHSNLCTGNGKCRGDGTRKGNGTCFCNAGHTGKNCEQCTINFYPFHKDDKKFTCLPCHTSCSGGCREGTQKDCVACKTGFIFDQDDGCVDINECDYIDQCKKNQFCMNSLGSFICQACDKSCNGCYGDGPDGCRKCAKGYSKKGELCIEDREDEHQYAKLMSSRYITYIGLLIATCILLPASTHLGSFVGVTVIWYIICAEYYCMVNELSSFFNLKELILTQLFT